MKDYIEERAVHIANYIIENNATVRQTAKIQWKRERSIDFESSQKILFGLRNSR